MEEIWKYVKGYEGLYLISNLGRVKNLQKYYIRKNIKIPKKQCELKTCKGKVGYIVTDLNKNNKRKTKYIHRLVAEAFIPNPENKPCVNHKDGNKLNNKISNLEWVTYSENNKHAWDNNLKPNALLRMKAGTRKIKVNQYDLEGNFIKQWDSIIEAEKHYNTYKGRISICCKKNRIASGYKWKYD